MSADRTWVTDVQVCPSILAADFGSFRSQVVELLDAGARTFHVDVMDGHFVPVITFGTHVVSALADVVHERGGALAVHMMVTAPERFIDDYASAGADALTVHVEAVASGHVHHALQSIEAAGMVSGVTLNPATPVALLAEAARYARNLLLMSVDPGWGGQSFIEASVRRLGELRALAGPDAGVEIDGGIGPGTIESVYRAGANRLTAGSAIYSAPEPGEAYLALLEQVRGAGRPPWA